MKDEKSWNVASGQGPPLHQAAIMQMTAICSLLERASMIDNEP